MVTRYRLLTYRHIRLIILYYGYISFYCIVRLYLNIYCLVYCTILCCTILYLLYYIVFIVFHIYIYIVYCILVLFGALYDLPTHVFFRDRSPRPPGDAKETQYAEVSPEWLDRKKSRHLLFSTWAPHGEVRGCPSDVNVGKKKP